MARIEVIKITTATAPAYVPWATTAMIIQPNSENDKRKQALLQEDTELTPTEASGSNVPPPPFAADAYTINEAAPLVHNTSDMELGPPPEFAPYQAEQIELSNQDVVSHDPHLNFDGAPSV